MERVGEHPVPAGPLAVRWLGYTLPSPRAGALTTATVVLENAGGAAWRRIELGYHWLDERGNPLVWGGLWKPLGSLEPGGRTEADVELRAPIPPGRYRLAFDLVSEGRYWFSELGNSLLELTVEVLPRLERRALGVLVEPGLPELAAETQAALRALEEPLAEAGAELALAHLAPGCLPAPDWSRRVLDAHEEGYAVVAGSVAPLGRRPLRGRSGLEPWLPGPGRVPGFDHPLLCPSLIHGAEPSWTWLEPVQGLPALDHPRREPWLYDGRITLRLRRRG